MDLLHLVKDLIVSVPCVPKRQERDLDKLKEYLTIRRSVKWAQNNYHHIEVLLSSYKEENKNPEGLLWGEQTEEPILVYTLGPVQGRTPPQSGVAEDKRNSLLLRLTFHVIPWNRISTKTEKDNGKNGNI